MKSKLKLLALSASLLAGFAATPAHAYVYGDASLAIQNLRLVVNGVTAGGVTNFTFTASDSATLNGLSQFNSATCLGNGPGPGQITNCNATAPRLNPAASNAPGSSAGATRGNLDFSYKGPAGGMTFSNAAASIDTSELVGDASTATRQITESQLQGNGSASATTSIQSITGFAFTFTTGANGTLSLNFGANPDLFASIVESMNGLFSAQGNLATVFSLQQLSGGTSSATWNPSGTPGVNDCVASGFTCTETNDQENLNATAATTTVNTSDAKSHGDTTFSLFGINVTGLSAGTYRLTLSATSSTQLSRLVVPEPGTVMLMGIGLAGLAFRSRRSKKQAA